MIAAIIEFFMPIGNLIQTENIMALFGNPPPPPSNFLNGKFKKLIQTGLIRSDLTVFCY